ncbi:hypothetical protein DPMN_145997 [Dreissena polymorpha]|uniref:Uncharacterized protein n=1 Tax=Dreissena polymorpha TaxID=45954 RepID=A0A9D4IZC2_DREPO|nr:hypothetical protein DPMN_145997 [Dreissena polymorpha]
MKRTWSWWKRGGRGVRGRGSSRGRGGRNTRSQSKPRKETTTTPKELNIETDITAYFVGNVSADQHYEGQQQNRDRYTAAMAVLQNNGVDIAQNARIRAFAAAWARHDYELAEAFLQNKDNFGLLEVLEAARLWAPNSRLRKEDETFTDVCRQSETHNDWQTEIGHRQLEQA